jgi:hypothetical protein
MNNLVKIIADDDGELTNNEDWHLVDPGNAQGNAALCTGEFFGGGESTVRFEMRTVQRGGVTCRTCLDLVKIYKAVRL